MLQKIKMFLKSNKEKKENRNYDLKDNKKLKNLGQASPLFKEIESKNYETIEKDYITVVCLSDTHLKHKTMKKLP